MNFIVAYLFFPCTQLWRFYQWFGSVGPADFRALIAVPAKRFVVRQMLEALRSLLLAGAGEDEPVDLTKSVIATEHPWVAEFIRDIGPLLEETVEVHLPQHFLLQIFRLFDLDGDGRISKQEFVRKCLLLTTGGHKERIQALFTLFDDNRDGVVSLEEVQRMTTDVAKLLNETSPQFLQELSRVVVEQLIARIYRELELPQGRIIPAERLELFLLGLRRSLPADFISRGAKKILRSAELDKDELFRRYAVTDEKGSVGLTPPMFSKAFEDILDTDALFQTLSTFVPYPSSVAVQKDIEALRAAMRERFFGQSMSISGVLFQALDLDDNGVITRTEFDAFIDLLTGEGTVVGSDKQNDLEKSYAAASVAQLRAGEESEVQHVMHVLSKNRRVPLSRLQGLLEAVFSMIVTFVQEWIDVHTCKEARVGPLRNIVKVWFHEASKGQNTMTIPVFSEHLGNRIVSVFESFGEFD